VQSFQFTNAQNKAGLRKSGYEHRFGEHSRPTLPGFGHFCSGFSKFMEIPIILETTGCKLYYNQETGILKQSPVYSFEFNKVLTGTRFRYCLNIKFFFGVKQVNIKRVVKSNFSCNTDLLHYLFIRLRQNE
jgi:hypothetical protein